ncbi:MAG: hypothetical protein IBJ07_13145 [Rhizobiaceae bacterium]|nr:hypothetical protein [Rhizobiaceae bacterium]
MSDDLAKRAAELSTALRDMHKALIHAEAGDDPAYANPYTLLFDVIGNPRFAWLESLSQLIVVLDEARADKETFSGDILTDAARSAGRLIGEGEDHDAQFRLRHLMAVQNAPDVAIATGRLRRTLASIT